MADGRTAGTRLLRVHCTICTNKVGTVQRVNTHIHNIGALHRTLSIDGKRFGRWRWSGGENRRGPRRVLWSMRIPSRERRPRGAAVNTPSALPISPEDRKPPAPATAAPLLIQPRILLRSIQGDAGESTSEGGDSPRRLGGPPSRLEVALSDLTIVDR